MSKLEIEQLEKLLNFLLTNSHLAHVFGPTQNALLSIKARLDSRKKEWVVPIKQMIIPIKNSNLLLHNPCLVIGGIIEGYEEEIIRQSISLYIVYNEQINNTNQKKINQLNTSCCIAKGFGNRIVRKFHFDYQIPNIKNLGIIPISHIQYGGELKVESGLENLHYCLDDYLETPRICFPPLNLALLLDFILREFETDVKKLILEGYWKKLIKESEKGWLEDYFKKIENYFKQEIKKQTFFDYLYNMKSIKNQK